MGSQGLHNIMNDVASMLDGMVMSAPKSAPSALREPMSEMDAFIEMDPLLAQLHKDFIDARQMRTQAQKEYGADDAMTEMAAYSEDSAWCAMQTRYMELRADRDNMAQAQELVAEDIRECEREARELREEETLKLYGQMQVYHRMRERHGPSAAQILFFYILLMINPRSIFDGFAPSYNFNRLAA